MELSKRQIIAAFALIVSYFLFGHYIALAGNCWGGWSDICWSRWDSGLYLGIAKDGHTLYSCTDDLNLSCGNAGWAPLYPALIRLLHEISGQQIPLADAGIYISTFFWICSLYWVRNESFAGALLLLLAPGNIYFHAIFPMSLLAFFVLGMFYFLERQKYLLSGIMGYFAALSYSIGFILIACLGVYALYQWRKKVLTLTNAAKLVLIPLAGIITWFAYDYFATGKWNALFLIQGKYGHHVKLPFEMMYLKSKELINAWGTLKMSIELQNYVIWIAVILAVIKFYKIRTQQPLWLLLMIFTLLYWWLPYSSSSVTAVYRNVCVLLPAWIYLFRHITPLQRWIALTVMAAFSVTQGILFIQSILV